MRVIITAFFLLLLYQIVSAQSISPMLQVMSSNSLLNRPKEIVDLQLNLEKEIGKVKPGLEVDALYKKISVIRKQVISALDSSHLECNLKIDSISTKTYKITYTFPKLKKGESNKDSFQMTIDSSKIDLLVKNIYFKPSLNDFFEKIDSGLANYLDTSLFDTFKNDSKSKRIYESLCIQFGNSIKNQLKNLININVEIKSIGKIISSIFIGYIKNYIQEIDPLQSFDAEINIQLREFLIKGFNTNSIRAQNELIRIVSDALNEAEKSVYNSIDKYSEWLISSGIGISVTEGNSAMNGGIFICNTISDKCQLGIYFNGSMADNAIDSASNANGTATPLPTRSLIGALGRFYSGDNNSFDFSISGNFGDEQYQAFKCFETGLGYSGKIPKYVIIGIGINYLFTKKDNQENDWLSYGLTLRLPSDESPTFILNGSSHVVKSNNDTGTKFSFQIVQPIFSKK